MTNVTPGAYADTPLFLSTCSSTSTLTTSSTWTRSTRAGRKTGGEDEWSQLIVKETDERGGAADGDAQDRRLPARGGRIVAFARRANDWHNLIDESEAFYLRVAGGRRIPLQGRRLGVSSRAGGCRATTSS